MAIPIKRLKVVKHALFDFYVILRPDGFYGMFDIEEYHDKVQHQSNLEFIAHSRIIPLEGSNFEVNWKVEDRIYVQF